MDIRDAWESQREHDAGFEANRLVTPAEIISIGGSVYVSDRPGFIWVREYSQGGGVFQALNPHVQAREGLPVLVGYEPKAPWRRVVLDPDWSLIVEASGYDGDPYLPNHSIAHEWPDGNPGGDVVDVHMRAMVPLRTYASTSLTVNVAPCRYHYNNIITSFPGKTGYDISAHKPASGLALYVLVYLDMATNAIGSTAGATIVDSWGIPTPPSVPAGAISSALIRLDGDQTTIAESDIVDVRTMWGEGGIIVHTHASNAQGGQLDWDNVWTDAVHDHSAAGEGGTHWGGITQTFGGASAANIVTVPDNVAQALNVVDAGALEYMRIVSTDAQPAVVFDNAEADIDFRVAASGITNALFVQGSSGFVGVGGIPTTQVELISGVKYVQLSATVPNPRVSVSDGTIIGKWQVDTVGVRVVVGAETNHMLSFITNNAAKLTILAGGDVGIGTTLPTAKVDINSDILRLRTTKTPASGGAAGNAGDICWDINYIYVCVAANTWRRSSLAIF